MSALSHLGATCPTWLSRHLDLNHATEELHFTFTYFFFTLNSHVAYLDNAALQTLLSH